MFDFQRTPDRQSNFQGRITGGSGVQGVRYPSPFFDIAHTFLPSTIKEMFRWCRYYFLTNPLISATINKMAEYPITDIIVDEDNPGLKDKWERFFEDTLRLRPFLIEAGLFFMAYGNAMVSISHPFIKWLICPHCKKKVQATKAKFQFRETRFFLSCPHCGDNGDATAYDQYLRSPDKMRLILWNPEDIELEYNELTGETRYFYTVPMKLKNQITMGKRDVVTRTPQIFIDSVKQEKSVVISPDNIFHFKRPSILTGHRNRGWGVPIILPVLKDVFYLQIMKKAQESVLINRITPLTVLFPQAGSGSSDPFSTINLVQWKDQISKEIQRWQRDSGYIPILPLPIGQQVIGGDGRALLLTQEIQIWSDQIIMGLGVPLEFVKGGLQWCLDRLTRVYTTTGIKYLGDVVDEADENTHILTEDGPRKIGHFHKVGEKPALKLRTRRGFELTGAGTHPILTLLPDLRLEYKNLSEISEGDYVVTKRGGALWPDQVSSLPVVERRGKEYDVEVPDHLTKDAARLFGYITSEGYVTEDVFRFSNTDPDVMTDFLECFKSVFGYEPTVQEPEVRGTWKKIYVVDVSRKALCRFLIECGFGVRSDKQPVPTAILESPATYVSEYLSTYFEGDGGVAFKPSGSGHVHAVTASADLARDVQLLLLNLGVLSSRYPPTKASPVYKVVVRGKADLLRFQEVVGFRSPTKIKKLDALLSDVGGKYSDKLPYIWEALRLFRDKFRAGNNNWQWEPFEFEADVESYNVSEVATILERAEDTVRQHIEVGRLTAEKNGKAYRILGEDLEEFCRCYGRGKQVPFPRLHKGATRFNMKGVNLDLVEDKDPELAVKIKAILDSSFVFDQVDSIEEAGVEMMYDLTVEGTHSYIANGLVTHNSGSNVSMRMLENQFLGYIQDLSRFVRIFLIPKISAWLGWSKISARFKPFKMADDLQRKALYLQLNQGGKISDTTLLQDSDFNPKDEDELMSSETERRLEAVKKQQLAEAEIQGEMMLLQSKYQAKAQAAQQVEMMQAQMGQSEAAPGEPADMVGSQPVPGAQAQPAQLGSGMPGGAPPTGVPPQEIVQQLAQRLAAMAPDAQRMAVEALGQRSQELAQAVWQALQQLTSGGPQMGGGAAGKPLPEQRPPQRGPESAII